MGWIDHPFNAFDVEWRHQAGWIARIALTPSGQFVANLNHPSDTALILNYLHREGISGYQYQALSKEALSQFDAWIEQKGAEALGDLPVSLELSQRQAAALLESIPALMNQAGSNLGLRDALTRLKLQIEGKP